MRAAEAAKQRKRRLAIIITSSVAVIAVIAAIVIVGVTSSSDKKSSDRVAATDALVSAVAHVPAATLDAIGKGSSSAAPKASDGDPVYKDGDKAKILFIGAEFCPYCAAERWSLVQALSRFGTFKDLKTITSSPTDVFPSTATFSFYKSTYTSDLISFVAREDEDGNGKSLDPPTDEEQGYWTHYTGNPASFPFVYIAGAFAETQPGYDPGVLKGLTAQQIADSLKDPTSKVAKAVDGAANVLTAAICTVTGSKPSSVCGAAGVKASASALK